VFSARDGRRLERIRLDRSRSDGLQRHSHSQTMESQENIYNEKEKILKEDSGIRRP
jgi:hypothetical protein